MRYGVESLGGVAPGMLYLTGTGGEKLPEGGDPLLVMVERSVALRPMNDAILAWEMNGAPLSLAHGGPLRLVVPGYQGVNNVKYVKRVAFTSAESQAKIMTHGYRITPLGGTSNPAEPSAQEMGVKSWVNAPNADRAADAADVLAQGRALFVQGATPPCATCHTLKDDGASGAVGPVLDELQPDAERVISAMKNGIGLMPSFRASLDDAQIRALARYVSKASGGAK